jgi:serine/threonine protein kinase
MQPKPASNANLLALPDGTELVGDFRIKRVLGAGGFGITYLAEETALARLVTIKEYFPADFAAREGTIDAAPRSLECATDYKWGLDRFIEEAQTLARFVHPNIVRVYRYFRANKTGYMVLQFEEGGSFKAWLKGLKRAPRQAELDAITAPLLDALEMVHKGDFLHRDIAPDNIIIRRDGSPVLIDFGSARGEIAAHSKTVSALVKPGYSPYEQYATNSRQQGPWTDIYALGATLYHAVCGKRPQDAPSRVVADEYTSAREAALSSYRPGFLAAIDKALVLDVTQRPQSIAAWRGALLAPEPKRERGRLGLPLRGKWTTRPPLAAAAVPPLEDAKTEVLTAEPKSLIPAPPDAPQAKGQLLDFIEALRKQRPILAPRKTPAQEAKAPAVQPVAPPLLRVSPAADPPDVQFGLGYGPPPDSTSGATSDARPAPVAKTARKKAPATPMAAKVSAAPKPRAGPRPRRGKAWRLPSRSWRSLLLKLLIGIAIASFAVAYQEKDPKYQGRGAAVVSSQATDLAQVPRLTGHTGAVTAVGTADQGRWIVSAGNDGTLRVWNAGSGALVRTIELDDGAATAFAVDERRALTGHSSGAIVLWDLERADKLATFQHRAAAITSLAFTAEPESFAAVSQDGAVGLFDARSPSTPRLLAGGTDDAARIIVAARLSGLIAVADQGRIISLWRADARDRIRDWRSLDDAVTALDVAPGGSMLASGSSAGTLRLYSVSSSRATRTIRAHEGRVTSLGFSPTQQRLLASAGDDGAVKLWNLRTGHNVRAWYGHSGPVRALSFTPDGRRVISGGQDGAIRIWPVQPGGPRD